MSDTDQLAFTGESHPYSYLGAALDLFAGNLDRTTLDTLHGAMRDAAEDEWERAVQDADSRMFHVIRWNLLTQGASYAALVAGDKDPEVQS